MADTPAISAYLALVEKLYLQPDLESDLHALTAPLPRLDQVLLDHLGEQSRRAAYARPRYGWALAALLDAAAGHTTDRFLHARAAWQLGRAATGWVRPDRVASALQRAREAFIELNEPGWLAACEWQLNELIWVRNFTQASAELNHALDHLIKYHFDEFVPHCRLALAYAQILASQTAPAAENIARSEQDFAALGDAVQVARCVIYRGRNLRQQGDMLTTRAELERALQLLNSLSAPVESGRALLQLAFAEQYSTDNPDIAIDHFQQALHLFEQTDLPLLAVQCHTGLAQIYYDTGRLSEAVRAFDHADLIFAVQRPDVLYADYLVNSGKLHLRLGHETRSLQNFSAAEILYQRTGSLLMPAIAALYRGEALSQLGRYQEALHHIERAQTQFEQLHRYDRVAECAIFLALLWQYLGRFPTAHAYLDQATHYYEQAQQPIYLATVYNLRARSLFYEQRGVEALGYLQQALDLAQQQGVTTQIVLAQRLLGEALCALDRSTEAVEYLQNAVAGCAEMQLEQAICLAALGRGYFQIADYSHARTVWEQALDLNRDGMPETDWLAWAGLAQLAEADQNDTAALDAYRRMATALAQLRQNFSQPTLIGTFLQRPAPLLEQAVAVAARYHNPYKAAYFIEAHKAQIAQRIVSPALTDNAELQQLEAELRWLRDRVRESFGAARRLGSAEERELLVQLRRKTQQYAAQRERWERTARSDQNTPALRTEFDLATFVQLATQRLGDRWLALDYYLTTSHLYCLSVTANECTIETRPLTASFHFALEQCTQTAKNGRWPTTGDLAQLGHWLLPATLGARITPATSILIAPHRQLHQVPWAALIEPTSQQPLMECGIPGSVLSLHSLQQLWLRPCPSEPRRLIGLAIGVSDFGLHRAALPQVTVEIEQLLALWEPGSRQLLDEKATWANWQALRNEPEWPSFRFLHIASHAFHDASTGRLSGIALHDQDLWLDQLEQLAPLPELITLSACSGTQALIYEGDELIGLPTTCLAAGAQHVVGSLWPVLDEDAVELMQDFYRRAVAGEGPAKALALAQRAAHRKKAGVAHWGSFGCAGAA